jgi:hypothetical protein
VSPILRGFVRAFKARVYEAPEPSERKT